MFTGEIDREIEAAMDTIVRVLYPSAKWGFVAHGPRLSGIAPNAEQEGVQFLSYWFTTPFYEPKDVPWPVTDHPRVLCVYRPGAGDDACTIAPINMPGVDDKTGFTMSTRDLLVLALAAAESEVHASEEVSQ